MMFRPRTVCLIYLLTCEEGRSEIGGNGFVPHSLSVVSIMHITDWFNWSFVSQQPVDGKCKVCLSKPASSLWIYRDILYFISNVCIEILLHWFYFSKYIAVVYHILFFTFVWTGFAVCYEMLFLHIYLHIIYMARKSFKRSTPEMWQNKIQALFYLIYQHLCCGLVVDCSSSKMQFQTYFNPKPN